METIRISEKTLLQRRDLGTLLGYLRNVLAFFQLDWIVFRSIHIRYTMLTWVVSFEVLEIFPSVSIMDTYTEDHCPFSPLSFILCYYIIEYLIDCNRLYLIPTLSIYFFSISISKERKENTLEIFRVGVLKRYLGQ